MKFEWFGPEAVKMREVIDLAICEAVPDGNTDILGGCVHTATAACLREDCEDESVFKHTLSIVDEHLEIQEQKRNDLITAVTEAVLTCRAELKKERRQYTAAVKVAR